MTCEKVVIELYNGHGDEIKCVFVLVSGSYTTCTGPTSLYKRGDVKCLVSSCLLNRPIMWKCLSDMENMLLLSCASEIMCLQ